MPIKQSVLIADDDEILRELLRQALVEAGYRIAGQASNGQEAINLCLKRQPNIVLLDINMPILDGITALSEIRKTSPLSKVIMISGEATLAKVQEAIKLGAIGFIVKPFTSGKILSNIEACLNKNSKGTS